MKRLALLAALLAACATVDVSPAATHTGSKDEGVVEDLSMPVDSAPGPDLTPPPDLRMVCTTDQDCSGSSLGSFCDVPNGVCVTCVSRADNCAVGHYCVDATHTCQVGCKTTADCASDAGAALVCNTSTHRCVGCNGDGDCAPGTLCSANACVPGCTATHACDGTKTCCTGQCKNLQGDAMNCGACGVACDTAHSTGASCAAGACTYTGCTTGYADCGTASPDLDGCETSTSTTAHCGGCNACSTGTDSTAQTCDGTRCGYTCSSGRIDCNAGVGQDTDGCECATVTSAAQGTAGCCPGHACQTSHDNGYGTTYLDCAAQGTYNGTQALEAANSATSQAGTASDGWTCGSGSNVGTGVCKQSATSCTCWIYASTGSIAVVGRSHSNTASNGCVCANASDPSWN